MPDAGRTGHQGDPRDSQGIIAVQREYEFTERKQVPPDDQDNPAAFVNEEAKK